MPYLFWVGGSPDVAIINETFALRSWPGETALGHRVSFGGAAAPCRTVVGVVRDLHEFGYEPRSKPGLLCSVRTGARHLGAARIFVIRTEGDPVALAAPSRGVVARVDVEPSIASVRTLDDIVEGSVSDRRQQMMLLGAFSSIALLLAAMGLYGVLSSAVTQRSREIGLRIALGAITGAVSRLVIGRVIALTAMGLAVGVAVAWAATRTLQTFLHGVEANDPATFGTVVALLGVVALTACTVPALRAARVDPIRVLRQD